MEHALFKVMRSTAVNSNARRAVRQGNCSYSDSELSRAEMIEIITRLQRKQGLLKIVLGIKNKAQHTNLMAALNGKHYGSGKFRARNNPRSAVEYHRCGQEIQRMNRGIQVLKATEKGVPIVQHGWVQ